MKKPKYFKGVRRKKEPKEPVVVKSAQSHVSSKAEFPKNSRAIPERHHRKPGKQQEKLHRSRIFFEKKLLAQVWSVAAIIVLIVLGIAVNGELVVLRQKSAERAVLAARLYKWEHAMQKYPGYRDGYISIAAISLELGDRNGALTSIGKALALDPNNETAIQLEELILKNK